MINDKRKEYIRKWQRECLKRRRQAWLRENGPCVKCGSTERLEVDHINPAEKKTHAVWSWKQERRMAELKKCQVLCYKCHKKKSGDEMRAKFKDRPRITSQTVPDQKFLDVINLLKQGFSQRKACEIVGISRSTFSAHKSMGLRPHIFGECLI